MTLPPEPIKLERARYFVVIFDKNDMTLLRVFAKTATLADAHSELEIAARDFPDAKIMKPIFVEKIYQEKEDL